MDADVQNGSGSVKTEFIQIVQDFSQYLYQQKKRGCTSFKISEQSQSIINKWGSSLGGVKQSQEPFFFQGSKESDIFILDSTSNFYKGKSGALLIKILAAMKLEPDSVFICNAGDLKDIDGKIAAVSPRVIITLGTKAGQTLLEIKQPLNKFQGRFHEYHGIKVMPTFHPSLLLKHPEYRRNVWDAIQMVMKYTGIKYGE